MTTINHEGHVDHVNRETCHVVEGFDLMEMTESDMHTAPGPTLKTSEEPGESSPLEIHHHLHPHDHAHVDLRKDEYIPEEVALMLGTSVEVIMRAIRYGDLKAESAGGHVVCIPRAALLAWYRKG